MPKSNNPKVDEAKALYLKGIELKTIAEKLKVAPGTVRSWKNRYKWECNATQKKSATLQKKRGAPKGSKNSPGPKGNKHAEKHGIFSKYLPKETMEIVNSLVSKSPLDILWDQITVQYSAIIRAQKIMHVKDINDKTKEVSMDSAEATAYTIQEAWDKQASFLSAQSRAMGTLNNMIKNYDDLLHKNWDIATEEQRARVDKLKAETTRIKGEDIVADRESDGFIEALGEVKQWQEK